MSITSPLDVSVLASCKGLLFLDFHQVRAFCIFNPTTVAHQLIPYPEPINYFKIIESEDGGEGLLVDYPNSGQYKLVIVRKLDDQPRGGYIFNVFSSSCAGLMWHESQFRSKFCNALLIGHAVYLHGCLHWLRSDGNVVVFDTTGGHRIINMPEVIKSYVRDPLYGIISFRFHSWMGVTRGLLTLVCAFEKLIVIFTYDYYVSSNNWTVSHTLANFNPADLGFLDHGVPMWFDGEKLLFLVRHWSESKSGYLYEYDYDSEIKKVHDHVILDIDTIKHFFSFEPTLANVVVPLLPHKIRAEYRRDIATTLGELKCLLTDKSTVTEERPVNKFPYLN
ncbi:hypothetical protein MTR67_038925 [Solanum verrucosum]|uniref:Uncharacterized protein n=1 Tax=Solanum verrucosum TaxID=315347 RepID=A0AAF0UGX7_SOLVR|nr:uncharacterized protein LOC125838317 [Solanum verrucosum]WMV45540.1 hypothetical protein MTR67_038925 [Solanum verrucosum]